MNQRDTNQRLGFFAPGKNNPSFRFARDARMFRTIFRICSFDLVIRRSKRGVITSLVFLSIFRYRKLINAFDGVWKLVS